MLSGKSTAHCLPEMRVVINKGLPDMDGMNERVVIRHGSGPIQVRIAGRQHAQAIALTARAPFEAMMAVSTVALVAALAAALWQGLL